MPSLKMKDLKLQALRIPAGWAVAWNQFYDVEPGANIHITGLPGGDVWELFLQDLLQLENQQRSLILDLGWSPEANPDGSYVLTLAQNKDWLQPVATFRTKSKDEVVEQINDWLARIATGVISDFSPQNKKV